MVLLRRVIGDALRARRQNQHRTLREVSTAANVSLGYLSEIERGHKEASSELLASICEALGARLSEVLNEVSTTMAVAEQLDDVLAAERATAAAAASPATAARSVRPDLLHLDRMSPLATAERPRTEVATDGKVSVTVRRETPLRTTMRARNVRKGPGTGGQARGREVVSV